MQLRGEWVSFSAAWSILLSPDVGLVDSLLAPLPNLGLLALPLVLVVLVNKRAPRVRATECSNTKTPRGATCKLAHPPPCFRDNLWPEPVPRRLWDDKTALAGVEKDRTAGAASRGETCIKLVPAPPTETVSLLYDVADDDDDIASALRSSFYL